MGEAGLDLGTSGEDARRRLTVGGQVAFASDGCTAQDDGLAVGVEGQQVRRGASVSALVHNQLMWDNNQFRMPDGAKITDRQGDQYKVSVRMPFDTDGFFGRQCPQCAMLFRVNGDDYEALPEEIQLWCVYCGHSAHHTEFWTDQQRERAMEAGAYAYMRRVRDPLCGLRRASLLPEMRTAAGRSRRLRRSAG
ncbi:hypothetical protein ACWGI8_12070 [Streptomyces sp. NPDC054841]